MIRSFAALSLLLVSTTALAAPARPAHDPAAWDVNAPPGATLRQVQMNVSEGTWMNVDVSPDGAYAGSLVVLTSDAVTVTEHA